MPARRSAAWGPPVVMTVVVARPTVAVVVTLLSGLLVLAAPCLAQHMVVFESYVTGGEYEGDVDIMAQLVGPDGTRQWNDGERSSPFSYGAYREQTPVVIPDGNGGAILALEAVAREGQYVGDWEVFAQRISSDGELLWNEGEASLPVSTATWSERKPSVVPDGEGGAIIVMEAQAPDDSDWAGDVDIFAQRVSADGELLWEDGERSVQVAMARSVEQNPVAVADGEGGAIVFYEMVVAQGEHEGASIIAAQRIDSDGNLMWNDGDKPVIVSASNWQHRKPTAVSDGEGGALVFFEQHAISGQYEGDIDIAAQRVSPSGEVLWADDAAAIDVMAALATETAPRVIADGQGGAIVVAELRLREGEQRDIPCIVAQRISGDGDLLWEDGERSVVVSDTVWHEVAPCLVPDGSGGAYVLFESHAPEGSEWEGDIDVRGQRISADGRLLWSGDGGTVGVATAVAQECAVSAARTDDGIIACFEVARREGEYAGDWEIMAQRLTADGERVWNDGDRSSFVAASTNHERHPLVLRSLPTPDSPAARPATVDGPDDKKVNEL